MTYDFDREIDRRGTDSLKWDFAEAMGKPADALPLWVADMDFPSPPCVTAALRARAEHGIFGYTEVGDAYYETVAAWFRTRFSWETRPEWLVKTPGVVFALALAIRAFTEPGDAVLLQPPVYYPFYEIIRDNGRRIVENELVYRGGRYEIDFEDFEAQIRTNRVKLFLLCSPHNPVGRVWTRDELRRMGEICGKYGVYVASDEIHCDFAFDEYPHTMFLRANPELAARSLVCTAPSKTFNLAGLPLANIWIPDAQSRRSFRREIAATGCSLQNALSLAAAQAAYSGGGEWLDAAKAYMRGNLAFLREFLKTRLPELRLVEPEGTYFAWIDCAGLGLAARELDDLVTNRAKLWLDGGSMFGESGAGFQRVVLACTRKTLEKALTRLETAIR